MNKLAPSKMSPVNMHLSDSSPLALVDSKINRMAAIPRAPLNKNIRLSIVKVEYLLVIGSEVRANVLQVECKRVMQTHNPD